MTKSEIVSVLRKSAYATWSATLAGNSPSAKRFFEQIQDIKVGDLVVEISTISLTFSTDSIGVVVSIGPSRGYGKSYVIRPLVGKRGKRTVRWDNCHFIRIPNGPVSCRAFDR